MTRDDDFSVDDHLWSRILYHPSTMLLQMLIPLVIMTSPEHLRNRTYQSKSQNPKTNKQFQRADSTLTTDNFKYNPEFDIICTSIMFAVAMLNYHDFHPFQLEPLRRYFLVSGGGMALFCGSVLGMGFADVFRMVPWGLFVATIVCSLWYRFGVSENVEMDSKVEKGLEDVIEGDSKGSEALLVRG